eukprot:scaffold4478_cov385-Prasinococcus_capsulatus_cf.AAC.1
MAARRCERGSAGGGARSLAGRGGAQPHAMRCDAMRGAARCRRSAQLSLLAPPGAAGRRVSRGLGTEPSTRGASPQLARCPGAAREAPAAASSSCVSGVRAYLGDAARR